MGGYRIRRYGHLLTSLLLGGLLAACSPWWSTRTGQPLTGSFERKVSVSGQYLIYLPKGYSWSGDPWPLLLFLHGSGERGDDLDRVKLHGPPKEIGRGRDLPFVVLAPQAAKDQKWDSLALGALLDEVSSRHNVDPERIYVTGLSMGGYGAWELAVQFPNRFAAIAPVCGGGRPGDVCAIQHVPVWNFHGAKDDTVPLQHSQTMVDALRRCGGKVRFTVYPDAGHDSWTETYANSELYDWFLKQRRVAPSASDTTAGG